MRIHALRIWTNDPKESVRRKALHLDRGPHGSFSDGQFSLGPSQGKSVRTVTPFKLPEDTRRRVKKHPMKSFNMTHKEGVNVEKGKSWIMLFLIRTRTGQNFDPRGGASVQMASPTDSTRPYYPIPRLDSLQADTLEAAGTTRSDHHLYPTTLIPL
jgi:hypothetical protein